MSVVHNIRCTKCDAIYESHSIISAKHYNAFSSYICSECGADLFYDSKDKCVSMFTIYKPWTWFRYKYVKLEDIDEG